MGKPIPWPRIIVIAVLVSTSTVLSVIQLGRMRKAHAENVAKAKEDAERQAQLDKLMADLKAQIEADEQAKRDFGPDWREHRKPPPKAKPPCMCTAGDPLCACE